MKQKILFIINDMINGGGQRSLINLLEMMDYQQYDINLLLFKEYGDFLGNIPQEVKLISTEKIVQHLYTDSFKIKHNIKLLPITLVHVLGTAISKVFAVSGYNKGQIRWKYFYKNVVPMMKSEYDIAVSYLEGESLYYLVDKVKAKRKISFIHTDYSKIRADACFDANYLKNVDYIIGISTRCVEILQESFPEFKGKIRLLPNLISAKSIYRQANEIYPEEYRNCPNIILLSIGRLTALKGFDMAIKAASLLKRNGITFRWFILGDGELKLNLQKQIEIMKVEDCFYLLGVKNNPYPYIKNASIIVQTSKYEGKSMVLDEAKILKKPIVVTNYETVRDQINDKEGIIVEMSPKAICEGIIKMINSTERYESYLRKQNYDNEKELTMYYKVFGDKNEDS